MATIGSVRKTSNGCPVAERVPRQEGDFREPLPNIAAIDFGTTNCSVAYVTQLDGAKSGNLGNPGEGPQRLPLNRTFYRVPTAILFTPDGAVSAFGHDARAEYLNVADGDRSRWAYFEQIKMDLQHEENVHREMKIKAKNNTEYYLVDVITQILRFLKTELIEVHLQRGGHELQATDFDWVITVPAIWKARGKQMMREAGYKAGLCSESDCGPLQRASFFYRPMKKLDHSPDRVSLALEPESAAIYCQNMAQQQLAVYCDARAPLRASCYLIVDAGGGTVDISAHSVVDRGEQHVRMAHIPTGNDCGGTKVNKAFKSFLEKLVHDERFSRFVATNDEVNNIRNEAILSELIYDTFEKQKTIFGSKGKGQSSNIILSIRLPYDFIEIYMSDIQSGIEERGDDRVKLLGQELRITYSLMREEIFREVIEGILQCMAQTLREIEATVETVYLVGGFGGCQYLFEAIKERFKDKYRYIVPRESEFAVVRGAVLFRQRPNFVEARKVDATYGTDICMSFNPKIHNPEYKFEDDDGKAMCRNIFSTIVERGDIVRGNELLQRDYCPIYHNQKRMTISFYSSTGKDIWYITNSEGTESVKKIGEVVVEMPITKGDKNRTVVVKFNFTHTEIQVKAYDKTSENEVKVVLDFLS